MTVRYSGLKSYWATSEIVSIVRTIVAISPAPVSVSIYYRKWGTQLQKSEKLVARSGMLKANIFPNVVCQPHCRKADFLSGDNRGIFTIMLKGDMWSGDSLSMESRRWKCSGMRDSMASAISAVT